MQQSSWLTNQIGRKHPGVLPVAEQKPVDAYVLPTPSIEQSMTTESEAFLSLARGMSLRTLASGA